MSNQILSNENKGAQNINIFNTSAQNANAAGRRNGGILSYERGSIITAVMTAKVDGKAMLSTTPNSVFEVDASSVKGDVGDTLKFKVLKSGKDGITLEQIINDDEEISREGVKTSVINNVLEHFKKNNLVKDENKSNSHAEAETNSKTARAISNIKRRLTYISDNNNRSAMRELIQSGVPLENISVTVLSSAVREIEKKPVKESSNEMKAPDNAKTARRSAGNTKNPQVETDGASAVEKALTEQGLPTNEKNVRAMEDVRRKFAEAARLDDDAIARFLSSGAPVTVENLYISKYTSSSASRPTTETETDFTELASEIDKTLSREGVAKTEDNLNIAKFLLRHGLSVTEENITKTVFIKSLKEKTDEISMLEKAAENIRMGKKPAQVELTPNGEDEPDEADVSEIIDSLPDIAREDVEALAKKRIPINLRRLADTAANRIAAGVSAPAIARLTPDESTRAREDTLRLREIQLKLTFEASYRLAGKHINIATAPLKEIVDGLHGLEAEDNARMLRSVGAADGGENLERMNTLRQKLFEINPLTNNIFGNILKHKSPFSINGVHESTTIARQMEAYDEFATVPSSKHGDSYAKVRGQFGAFLERIGLESSEPNIRAAVILSKNAMDVTPEQITAVKLIDTKINAILNRLHPSVAAFMIKDGLNPAEMHADEVLEYIDKFNGAYGDGLADNIPRYILELDESKTLDTDTRKGVIAIYRMLHQIQKDGGAALGVTLKAGGSQTLGNLMESSKYYSRTHGKHQDIDMKVDDSSDMSTRATPETDIRSILSGISKALEETCMADTDKNIEMAAACTPEGQLEPDKHMLRTQAYNERLLRELASDGKPQTLIKLFAQKSDILNETLEEIIQSLNDMRENEASDFETEHFATRVREMLDTPPETILWMQNNQLPVTLNTVTVANKLHKNPFYLSGELNKIDRREKLKIMDSDLRPLVDGDDPGELLEGINENLEDMKAPLMDEDNTNEIGGETPGALLEQLKLIQTAIKVQNYVNNGSNSINVPLRLHNKITSLNMYVLNDKLDTGESPRVFMSLDTESLGVVSMNFLLGRDGTLSVEVNADQPGAAESLRDNYGFFETAVSALGIDVTDISFKHSGVQLE